MIVECRECDWHASSASNLAELDFMFHHGPEESHGLADLLDDYGRTLRVLHADGWQG